MLTDFFISLFFSYFIYLVLVVLGLCRCVWAFSSCSKLGPVFVVVRGLLIVVASLAVKHRLTSCGTRA